MDKVENLAKGDEIGHKSRFLPNKIILFLKTISSLYFLFDIKMRQFINLRKHHETQERRHYVRLSRQFLLLIRNYPDLKERRYRSICIHFLAVTLNGFRVSMPREVTVPFTGKISIYSGTENGS